MTNDQPPKVHLKSHPLSSGEKPDKAVTPDVEGFYGVPDAVIDDPGGYVKDRYHSRN
jgi:hypothetical protein